MAGCFYQCAVCGAKHESPDFKTPPTMTVVKTKKGSTTEMSFECKAHSVEEGKKP